LPQSVYELVRSTAQAQRIDQVGLVQSLTTDPRHPLIDALVDAATVPHTALFRHPEQFDHLRHVLVKLAARQTGTISVWCAGCATGQEAYSVAACAEQTGVTAEVLATDVSPAAIRAARIGRYALQRADPIGGSKSDAEWVASESLRRMTHFEVASLVGPGPELNRGPFHIVFCRNVLIYFERARVPAILERLAGHLHPAGAIVVSPADTVLPLPSCLAPGPAVGWLHVRGEEPPASLPAPMVDPTASLPPPAPPPSPVEQAARLLSAGEPAAAESILTALLNDNPDHLAGWFLLGETLLQRSERAQARAAFARASRCSPRDVQGFDAGAVAWAAVRRMEALTGDE
jgi:chemotaxis protein methyltransferase CheR